ncbi:MAG: histidine phosphatase family protein [Bacteroidota bacterium]
MELLVIRHGQSTFNVDGGGCDGELTALGRRQGQALADALADVPPDLWLCSPLRRALETLSLVRARRSAPARPWPDLHERVGGDMARFRGLSAPAVEALSNTVWPADWPRDNWWPEEPETVDTVDARAARVAARLARLGLSRVGMITHTVFGMALLRQLVPAELSDQAYLRLASVTTVRIGPSGNRLVELNRADHLGQILEGP